MSFLNVENIHLHYPHRKTRGTCISSCFNHQPPSHRAVSGLSLTVEQGELICLLGPNGSGKTSLLRCLAGFERPTSGRITLHGRTLCSPCSPCSPHIYVRPQHRPIGMVFQSLALFPHMTAEQNIAFGLTKLSKPKVAERLAEIYELCHLAHLKDKFASELSGGEKQRVAIARAVAPNPRLLLLDEPFSDLDPSHRMDLGAQIKQLLRRLQITAIMVMHDKNHAFELADRIALMFAGKITQLGTPSEVFSHPTSYQAASFLGDTSFISCEATDRGYLTPFGTISFDRVACRRELSAPLVMACKADDFILTHQSEQIERECTPQPFQILSEKFMGFYKTFKAQIPNGETITFRLPSDHSHQFDSTRICLKNTDFCVYEQAPSGLQ